MNFYTGILPCTPYTNQHVGNLQHSRKFCAPSQAIEPAIPGHHFSASKTTGECELLFLSLQWGHKSPPGLAFPPSAVFLRFVRVAVYISRALSLSAYLFTGCSLSPTCHRLCLTDTADLAELTQRHLLQQVFSSPQIKSAAAFLFIPSF